MLIKVILLVAMLGVALLLNRSTADARHQAVRRLMLMGFVGVAVLSVIFPQWLSAAARLVGVGRGTDLLVYALVVAFLSYMASSYRRTNILSARITALTRELTLSEALAEDLRARDRGPAGVAPAADDRPDVGRLSDPGTP